MEAVSALMYETLLAASALQRTTDEEPTLREALELTSAAAQGEDAPDVAHRARTHR